MKNILLITAFIGLVSIANAGTTTTKVARKVASTTALRVPEACEATLYRELFHRLAGKTPRQFVTSMFRESAQSNVIDLQIAQDHPDQNYCFKSGTVTVQYATVDPTDNDTDCKVQKVTFDSDDQFDCG